MCVDPSSSYPEAPGDSQTLPSAGGKGLRCSSDGKDLFLQHLLTSCGTAANSPTHSCCCRKGGPEGDGSSHTSIPCCPVPLGCCQCPALCCRADSDPIASLAVDEDLGEAPCAGGAVQRLAAEGGPGLLRADLRLPHQHVALAEEMISRALTSPAQLWQGG